LSQKAASDIDDDDEDGEVRPNRIWLWLMRVMLVGLGLFVGLFLPYVWYLDKQVRTEFAQLKTLDVELSRRRRRMYAGAALIGVLAAAVAIPVFALGQGSAGGTSAAANSVAVIDSGSNDVVASIPVGVISSEDVHANGGQLLVTYVNVDEDIDVNGVDLSARFLLSDVFSVGVSGSWVSDNRWQTESAGLVTLNAPTRKITATAGYDNEEGNGFNAELRLRYNNGFPVNSGVYIGTRCLGDASPLAEACVQSATLLDLNAGYRLPGVGRNTTLQLSVNNLLNDAYRPFPGTPTLRRMILARVKYDF